MPAASRLISRYSYKVKRLDAGEEIDNLRSRLAELEKRPSVKVAKSLCAASQKVLYALDELKYLVGGTDAAYSSRLQDAKDLLQGVQKHAKATVAGCTGSQAKMAEFYFRNIEARYQELVRQWADLRPAA